MGFLTMFLTTEHARFLSFFQVSRPTYVEGLLKCCCTYLVTHACSIPDGRATPP